MTFGSFGKTSTAALALLLSALAWWGVCVAEARRHLAAGDGAYARGDTAMARLEWEAAASRPAPGNRYASDAMGRLLGYARSLEAAGNTGEALLVCLSVSAVAHAADGAVSWYPAEARFARERAETLSRKAGVSFSPDRFTLYRPLRKAPALLSLLALVGCVVTASLAILRKKDGREAFLLPAVAAILLAAWLTLLCLA